MPQHSIIGRSNEQDDWGIKNIFAQSQAIIENQSSCIRQWHAGFSAMCHLWKDFLSVKTANNSTHYLIYYPIKLEWFFCPDFSCTLQSVTEIDGMSEEFLVSMKERKFTFHAKTIHTLSWRKTKTLLILVFTNFNFFNKSASNISQQKNKCAFNWSM